MEANEIENDRRPYVRMADPFAAMRSVDRAAEGSEDEEGYTLSSAPESMRKCCLELRSKIDNDEGLMSVPTFASDGRLARFPAA